MNPRLYPLALLVTVGLALTPFYAVSFLLVIVFVSRWNPWRSSLFASYLTRFVVQFLLFDAVAMLAGMYCWFAGVTVRPLAVLTVYLLLYWLGRRLLPAQHKNLRATYNDWLALGLASIGIVILLMCFYLPGPGLADSIRLITNGYDNTAHLSLIETVYRANGYVYGHYRQIKEQVAWSTLTAYPQGWHLANALWWKGTGAHPFSGSDISLRINFYVATLLIWQLIAGFLFTRISLYIAELFGLGKYLRQPGVAVGFAAGVLLIQMMLFWGTAFYGFTPFIAAVTYLLLIVAALLPVFTDKRESKFLSYYVALVGAGALTLAWLLPAPLVLLMIVLAFWALGGFRTMVRYSKAHRRTIVLLVLASLLVFFPIVAQVAINHLYSTEGSNQIDDDGGIFGLSSGLVLLILSFTTYIVLSAKRRDRAIAQAYLVTATPLLCGVLLIYAYQMATLGHTVYFFIKVTSLLLVVTGTFFGAALVKALSTVQLDLRPQLFSGLLAVFAIGAAVVYSGQPIFTFTSLLNRSVISNATASPLAQLAHSGQLVNKHVLVFTGHPSPDLQGSVFTTSAPLHFSQCVADVEWAVVNEPSVVPAKTHACTDSGAQFVFVTSSTTNGIVANMHDPRVRTVLVH